MNAASEREGILVLQHAGCEPPGAYEDELLARRIPFVRVRLDESEELPDWRAYAGIVAMGGSMGVHDEQAHPWLGPEKRLIGEAVRRRHALLGRVLGRAAATATRLSCRRAPCSSRRSSAYEQQAFALGGAYALQFHLEVSHALASEWMRLPAFAQELKQVHGTGALEALLEQMQAAERDSIALARELFSRWLENVLVTDGAAR